MSYLYHIPGDLNPIEINDEMHARSRICQLNGGKIATNDELHYWTALSSHEKIRFMIAISALI